VPENENIYFEARGEPLDGQYAVAEVTLNRTRSDTFRTRFAGWSTRLGGIQVAGVSSPTSHGRSWAHYLRRTELTGTTPMAQAFSRSTFARRPDRAASRAL